MSYEKSRKILNLTIQNENRVCLDTFLAKTDNFWNISLKSAGLSLKDEVKREYNVTIYLDDSIGEVQLANFIIPFGAFSYNYSPPWKTINSLRSQSFAEIWLRFQVAPLDSYPKDPVIRFGYINLELHAGSESFAEKPRKILGKKRKNDGK